VTVQDDGDGGSSLQNGAVGENTLSVKNEGTQLTVEFVDVAGGASDDGCSGISDSLAATSAPTKGLTVLLEVIHGELPVGLSSQRHVSDAASVASRVDATESNLTTGDCASSLAQPEGEERLRDKSLAQHVVPHGDNIIDRDTLEGQTEDTIELGSNKSQTRLLSGLSEHLALDIESTNTNVVLRQESTKRSRAILDRNSVPLAT